MPSREGNQCRRVSVLTEVVKCVLDGLLVRTGFEGDIRVRTPLDCTLDISYEAARHVLLVHFRGARSETLAGARRICSGDERTIG